MKLLTNFFSSAATKFPIITIIVILGITGFFGYMTTQAEELDTGFGGEIDTPECQNALKISLEYENDPFVLDEINRALPVK